MKFLEHIAAALGVVNCFLFILIILDGALPFNTPLYWWLISVAVNIIIANLIPRQHPEDFSRLPAYPLPVAAKWLLIISGWMMLLLLFVMIAVDIWSWF
jgi:hypothetical protein